MSDKFRTPHKTRFVKTPNTVKSTKKYTYGTTPKKITRIYKNIEDEALPAGFSAVDVNESNWQSIPVQEESNESQQSENDRPGPSGVSDSDGSGSIELSIEAEFDDLMNDYEFELDDLGECFLRFAEVQQLCHIEWQKSIDECKRLQTELDKANHDIGDFANKLNHARKMLDQEKKMTRRVKEECDSLEKQMALARDLLFNDQYKYRLPDETREKLAFLNNTTVRSSLDGGHGGMGNFGSRLNTINEVNSNEMNSTGSLLSDISFSRSEDDLDTSVIHVGKRWMKSRPVPIAEEPTPKKRRSSSGKVVEVTFLLEIIKFILKKL